MTEQIGNITGMKTQTCSHFQLPIADPGPCLACEQEGTTGPLVSFAGGRDGWRNGQTISETMRENRALWEAEGMTGDKAPISMAPGSRWV